VTPLRVVFLLSGSGTTLENLFERVDAGEVPVRVVAVVSDREGAQGLERARRRGIPAVAVPHPGRQDAFDAAMNAAVLPHAPDLVVMGGFLRLWRLPAALRGRTLNVHPSLLPAFGGKGLYGERVHRAVIASGAKVSGCTVHLVDDEYDHGPIVAQAPVEVRDDDTPEALAHRVQEAERTLYPRCIRWFAEGRLRVEGGRVHVLPSPAPVS
jgi:formyltetrahydrofolate-dependent phosphoribosylglycinamide formyltransferase